MQFTVIVISLRCLVRFACTAHITVYCEQFVTPHLWLHFWKLNNLKFKYLSIFVECKSAGCFLRSGRHFTSSIFWDSQGIPSPISIVSSGILSGNLMEFFYTITWNFSRTWKSPKSSFYSDFFCILQGWIQIFYLTFLQNFTRDYFRKSCLDYSRNSWMLFFQKLIIIQEIIWEFPPEIYRRVHLECHPKKIF